MAFTLHLSRTVNAFRTFFGDSELRRLLGAGALSSVSGWGYSVALSVFAFAQGGATAVGLVWVLLMVPSGLAAPFLAFLADRGRCERVLALSLAARAALLFLCGLAAWVELPAPSIYALAVVASVLARLANPAQAALLPLLARQPRQLRIANTVVSQTESLASVLGPALAGALLALVEPATVFVLAASGVLGASFLAWRIQAEEIPPLVAEAGRQRKFFAGLATVATNRSLRLLVSLYALQTLVAGALNVFLVVLALHAFDLGEGGVGSLNAALGLGGLLGGLVLYRRARERLSDDLRLGLFLWSLPLAALALVPVAAVAFVALALVGIGNTLVDVSTFTLVQRITPGPVRARVFGLLEGLSVAAIGVGALLAPVLMAVCGIRWSLATLGLFLALSTAAWWRGLSDEMTDAADRLATRADIRCSPFAPSMAS